MEIILDPASPSFTKKYLLSTGADYEISADGATGRSVPGLAVYHLGLDLVAVISTGEDVWELKVRGPVYNKTWQSVGIRWVKPNLDETVTLFPEERGGLEMYVNLEKVGQSLLPLQRPGFVPGNATTPDIPGSWTQLPPVQVPGRDGSGDLNGKMDGAPVMMFGCHWNQMADGVNTIPAKFDYYNQASIDEAAIWTRQLTINKTHDETLYFLGGYVKDLEEMTPAKFAEMLKAVDMSDPDQAAAAGSMSNKLMSSDPKTTTTTTTTAAPAPAGGASGGGSGSVPTSTSNQGDLAQLNT